MTSLHLSSAHHLNIRKKIFLILYLLLLYDTFSTRKPLFRIENIFCFNSFDRNTFFISANLFLNCIKLALPTCYTHILWIIKIYKVILQFPLAHHLNQREIFFLIVYQARCQHIFYSGKFF